MRFHGMTGARAGLWAGLTASALLAACSSGELQNPPGFADKTVSESSKPLSEAAGLGLVNAKRSRNARGERSPQAVALTTDLAAVGLHLVYFPGDSAEVRVEGRQLLDRQIGWLRQQGVTAVTIEGHADDPGTRDYNTTLSAHRAKAVRAIFIANGYAAANVQIAPWGRARPIVSCNGEACSSQNRRTQTTINATASDTVADNR